MKYQIDNINSRLIVEYKFNSELDDEFISSCNQVKSLIFNNYTSTNDMDVNSNKYIHCEDKKIFWRGARFNKEIGMLSETELEKLEFGVKFNKSVSNLPSSLQVLILGSEFNQELNNLPTNLKFLSLTQSEKFGYSLDYLPVGLEKLELSEYWYKSLENLPTGIKITFGQTNIN